MGHQLEKQLTTGSDVRVGVDFDEVDVELGVDHEVEAEDFESVVDTVGVYFVVDTLDAGPGDTLHGLEEGVELHLVVILQVLAELDQ